jgi:putative ABC transport system ATP-binding protein
VVMVTHDSHIASFADRIVFLRDGAIVDEMRLEPHNGANTDMVADKMRQLA